MTDQIIDQWAEKKGTREAFIQAEALKMALPEVMRSYYARTSTGYVATTEQLEPDYRKLKKRTGQQKPSRPEKLFFSFSFLLLLCKRRNYIIRPPLSSAD